MDDEISNSCLIKVTETDLVYRTNSGTIFKVPMQECKDPSIRAMSKNEVLSFFLSKALNGD